MQPRQFEIGDKVTAKAFVDCFGVRHEAVLGLVVTKCTAIDFGACPHHRILTHGPNPYQWVEAAESAFEAF